MRTNRILLCTVLAALLAGCGDRSLILKVDVLSYMQPSQTRVAFGPIPPAPGGLSSGEIALIDDEHINLLTGIGDVVTIDAVTISMATVAVDSTGSGEDTLRVYLSDEATDPRSTTPVFFQTLVFQPGVTDTVRVTVDGDSRVAQLFAGKKVRLTATTSLHGPASGPALNGRLQLIALDAVVVARHSKF